MNPDCPSVSRRTVVGYLATVLLSVAAPPAIAAEPGDGPVQIWFIRHAESELNVDTIAHDARDEGVTYPLTRTGVLQATALAEATANVPVTTIYTSTRIRAIQTADALAFKHGLNVKLAPEAAEIDLGIPLDSPDWRQLYRGLATRWVIDKDLAARIGEGESFADVQRRFLPFVRELMNRHADDTGVVVVVSHGATLGLLVPVLAPNVPGDLSLRRPLSNTSIIKTELRDGKLFCIEWAGLASGEFGE
ncbi:putative phosphoglycerate mutase [Povalibacter uvarum]|uniref:Putative phosphoglycerate mutase n=1 Tax=Povalibacter uvarum TaxID=732238 RepID=A0A841HP99_9GAMM|nr:histidine phosphatase family protein [Povalibacter uvarum]MBB6094464.1 putative phosphoglycerate mutase [Povalibacter uvarum]